MRNFFVIFFGQKSQNHTVSREKLQKNTFVQKKAARRMSVKLPPGVDFTN